MQGAVLSCFPRLSGGGGGEEAEVACQILPSCLLFRREKVGGKSLDAVRSAIFSMTSFFIGIIGDGLEITADYVYLQAKDLSLPDCMYPP